MWNELLAIAAWAAPAAAAAQPAQPTVVQTSIWTEASAIGTCLAAVFTALAVWISLHGIKKQIDAAEKQLRATMKQFSAGVKSSFLAKRPDVFIHLTTRFDQLYDQLPRPGAPPEADAELFRKVRAYWSLQLEQYQCYLDGFIDDEIYKYWMSLRCQEYAKGDANFRQKTDEALADFYYDQFQDFMLNHVFACWDANVGKPARNALDRMMKEAQVRRTKHLASLRIVLPTDLQ